MQGGVVTVFYRKCKIVAVPFGWTIVVWRVDFAANEAW